MKTDQKKIDEVYQLGHQRGYENGLGRGAFNTKRELKPDIPQFLADMIEMYKKYGGSLSELLASIEWPDKEFYYGMEKYRDNIDEMYEFDTPDLIAKAWLHGYFIERPNKWIVTLKSKEAGTYGDVRYFKCFSQEEVGFKAVTRDWGHEEIMVFDDKEHAEAVALLIGGKIKQL